MRTLKLRPLASLATKTPSTLLLPAGEVRSEASAFLPKVSAAVRLLGILLTLGMPQANLRRNLSAAQLLVDLQSITLLIG